jgi:cysteine rich repeat protein
MKRWLIPLSWACLFSLAAQAQNAPPPAGPREACKGDVEKLCPDVKQGGGRIIECLKEHKDQVSQACSDAMARARAEHHPPAGAGGQSSGQPPPGDQPPPPPSKPQQ